jgi:hypothetical protein
MSSDNRIERLKGILRIKLRWIRGKKCRNGFW